MFVKDNIGKFKNLPPKDRIRACAKLYREGKKMPAAMPAAKPAPMAKKARGKKAEGGSILGDIIPFGHLFGLGLDAKKPAKKACAKKAQGGNIVTPTMTASGGNFWDDFKSGADTALGLARHVLF